MEKTRSVVLGPVLERLFREGLMDPSLVDLIGKLRAKYPIGPDFCSPDPDDGDLPDGTVYIPEETIRAVQMECLAWYQAAMAHKISWFAAFDQIAYPAFIDATMALLVERRETRPAGRPKNEELMRFAESGLSRELTSKQIAAEWLNLHDEYPNHDASDALRKMTDRVKKIRRKIL